MSNSGHALFAFRGPMGVPVEIHINILVLVLIFVGLTGTYRDFLWDLIVVGILVVSILLHELGHAWACRVQGLRVQGIVVHSGGGDCKKFSKASQSEQELIALMGPIVNLTLWAVASLALPYLDPGVPRWMVAVTAKVNLFLALINLLPMNPLDGGKLFELTVKRLLPSEAATRLCGVAGLFVALLWVPAMISCFLSYGVVLFLLPSLRKHWDMARF